VMPLNRIIVEMFRACPAVNDLFGCFVHGGHLQVLYSKDADLFCMVPFLSVAVLGQQIVVVHVVVVERKD